MEDLKGFLLRTTCSSSKAAGIVEDIRTAKPLQQGTLQRERVNYRRSEEGHGLRDFQSSLTWEYVRTASLEAARSSIDRPQKADKLARRAIVSVMRVSNRHRPKMRSHDAQGQTKHVQFCPMLHQRHNQFNTQIRESSATKMLLPFAANLSSLTSFLRYKHTISWARLQNQALKVGYEKTACRVARNDLKFDAMYDTEHKPF